MIASAVGGIRIGYKVKGGGGEQHHRTGLHLAGTGCCRMGGVIKVYTLATFFLLTWLTCTTTSQVYP
jgi:hypothetical protein